MAGLLGAALWTGAALIFAQSDGTRLVHCGASMARVWRDPVTGRLQPADLKPREDAGRTACDSTPPVEDSSAP
jgi:hypothetical protein